MLTKDQSNVEKINLIAPALAKIDEDSFGPLTIDHTQNSIEVAIACSKRKQFEDDLTKWSSKKEDVICACFEAVDTRGNKQRELTCFRRDELRVQIKSPADQIILDRNDLRGGIKLSANVSSGASLAECHWAFYNQYSDAPALKGEGRIDGAHYLIDETAPVLSELTFSTMEPTLRESLSLAVGALAVALLMWRAPTIATSFIAGTSGLDFNRNTSKHGILDQKGLCTSPGPLIDLCPPPLRGTFSRALDKLLT